MVKANAAGTSLKGGGLLGEGRFHCVCESSDVETSEKFGNTQVKMKAVAYAPDEAKGRTLVDFLDVDGEYAGRLWAYAIALGLKTEADYEQAKADGSGEINEADFVGMQFFVEREMYKKGDKERWNNRYFALNDPAAKDFPRSQELLELLDPALAGAATSSTPSASGGNGNGSGGSGASKPPTNTAQSAGGGFDDPDM